MDIKLITFEGKELIAFDFDLEEKENKIMINMPNSKSICNFIEKEIKKHIPPIVSKSYISSK